MTSDLPAAVLDGGGIHAAALALIDGDLARWFPMSI
jgi:hypothetical protein